MNPLNAVCVIIGAIGVIFGIYQGLKKDNGNNNREIATLLADVGYIRTTVSDISNKVNDQANKQNDLAKKIATLEVFIETMQRDNTRHEEVIQRLEHEISELRTSITNIGHHE